MSNVGATTGDTPDFVDDGDLKTVAELRGAYQDMHKAKLSLNEKASVEGILAEVTVVKQQIATTQEQLSQLVSLYGTLRNEFTTFQAQRVQELNMKVNGGSTSPEDTE